MSLWTKTAQRPASEDQHYWFFVPCSPVPESSLPKPSPSSLPTIIISFFFFLFFPFFFLVLAHLFPRPPSQPFVLDPRLQVVSPLLAALLPPRLSAELLIPVVYGASTPFFAFDLRCSIPSPLFFSSHAQITHKDIISYCYILRRAKAIEPSTTVGTGTEVPGYLATSHTNRLHQPGRTSRPHSLSGPQRLLSRTPRH